MDPDELSIEQVRAIFRQQQEVQQAQRAAMQETASELRQAVLSSGVEPLLLRELELAVIDLALIDAMERTMDERGKRLGL